MEHYRLRKYRGPETWARVREAYVAGEPAASVALRFDVSVANIRKKSSREGWTRRHVAEAIDLRRMRGEPDPAPPPWETVELAPPPALPASTPAPEPAPAAPEPAVAPDVAVAKGLARASAALARGDAAGAAALTRAAEGLARATGHDPTVPPSPERLDGDEDAAREAEARAHWEDFHRKIEERAGVLALQLLADRRSNPAIHGGFALHWRAANLGPEAAAADRDAARDGGSFEMYWREDGTLRPLDQIRANMFGLFRQKIRTAVGLPVNGDLWGDRPVWE